MHNNSIPKALPLERLAKRDERAVITQLTPDPVLVGDPQNPNATSFTCGWCETMVLCKEIDPDQVYDVVFCCHSCRGLSASRRLAPGFLPTPTIVLDADYALSTLNIGQTRMTIVGIKEVALDQRVQSRLRKLAFVAPTGELDNSFVNDTEGDSNGSRIQLQPDVLCSLIERLAAVLGEGLFDRLWRQFERGRRSKTPSRRPNPLMELVLRVRQSIADLEQGRRVADMIAIGELLLAVTLFEAWSDDASWGSMANSFRTPGNFRHDLHLLAAASALLVQGYGVQLQRTEGSNAPRVADLHLRLNWREQLIFEVKTPDHLQNLRHEYLTEDMSRDIVAHALSSAGTGPGGQLDVNFEGLPRHSAALVIGAMHLGSHDLNMLSAAAEEILQKTGRRRSGLCAILFSVIRIVCERVDLVDGELVAEPGSGVVPQIVLNTVSNPFCLASIRLGSRATNPSVAMPQGGGVFVSPPPQREKW